MRSTPVVSLLVSLCASLSMAAVAPAPTDWKIAVGWNQTVLPSLGTSLGPFTPPAGTKAGLASGQLATAPVSALGKPGGVFICQNTEWQGECGCLDTISSFGPDPGATCFAFSSGNCDTNEAQWSFTYPGDDTGGLATTNPWNDHVTSFACVSS
ncbi:hypothetical protein K438DRAFT_5260 [Mycena galopus ATCC 62051]|nr:hypothetical protein K438DRAFT_5260 [Mycena galopus ATCC 62051]